MRLRAQIVQVCTIRARERAAAYQITVNVHARERFISLYYNLQRAYAYTWGHVSLYTYFMLRISRFAEEAETRRILLDFSSVNIYPANTERKEIFSISP